MNKIKRVRWSYVYRTLGFDAPWFGNTDIKVLFLFERKNCSIDNVKFFPFVTADSVFGLILMRYCGIFALPCAVLRYSYTTYAPLYTNSNWEFSSQPLLHFHTHCWCYLPYTVLRVEMILESYAKVYFKQFTTGNSPFQLVQCSIVPNIKKTANL